MKDIIIPELAESILEGTIAVWLVKEGDAVKEGDPLMELETDKIAVEVPSAYTGVIAELTAEEGDDVAVGQSVGKIDENAEASEPAPTEEAPAEEPAKEESVQQAAADQEPVASEEEGAPDQTPQDKQDSQDTQVEQAPEVERSAIASASPAARRQARQGGSSNGAQEGAQEAAPAKEAKAPEAPKAEKPAEETEPKYSEEATERNTQPEDGARPVERQRFSRRRQTIAKNLVEAQQTMAMLTTFNEVDMSAIMKLRKEVQDNFVDKHGVKLGFMSFFAKAVVGGLKQFPALNAELQGQELILKKYYDLGIAVSTDEGLVVPVVRGVGNKSFAEIEQGIAEMAEKARDGKLSLDDLQGGTFTITNGGVFGSTFSTPIINMPQAAILGMHNIIERVVVGEDGEYVTKPIMQIALTYDHRIVDGREAASFLTTVKQLLEDPTKLLLEG